MNLKLLKIKTIFWIDLDFCVLKRLFIMHSVRWLAVMAIHWRRLLINNALIPNKHFSNYRFTSKQRDAVNWQLPNLFKCLNVFTVWKHTPVVSEISFFVYNPVYIPLRGWAEITRISISYPGILNLIFIKIQHITNFIDIDINMSFEPP